MASEIQAIVVDKSVAPSKAQAETIAKRYAPKAIYTSRETTNEWRFRMRPPEDFKQDSFYTLTRQDGHVKIVIGELR